MLFSSFSVFAFVFVCVSQAITTRTAVVVVDVVAVVAVAAADTPLRERASFQAIQLRSYCMRWHRGGSLRRQTCSLALEHRRGLFLRDWAEAVCSE